jgi:hypothetical protein
LTLNTVPRIRKSFTWLYFFLAGLPGVVAGGGAAGAVVGGAAGGGSWAHANAAKKKTTSPAVQKIEIHCGRYMRMVIVSLDGGTSTGGCQVAWGVPLTLHHLLRLPRHHHRQ